MSALVPSPEQQDVLDLGLTSIRIRAGAGTGKTTTVAMVIANLIERHGVEPEQVLGITFTNKAAAELADKVRQMLEGEADPGRQIEVHTYHGFAAQVLSEFGALAGVDPRVRVITPTFSRQLLSETFHRTAYEHLDITNRQTLDKVRQLNDRLGDHLVDHSALMTEARRHDDEVWNARAEMARTLGAYDEDKRRLRVVDYSDLVMASTRVMGAHPHLAAVVRDRYEVVVLDEYQDTNPAQRVLLTTIFTDGFPVIAVGDEDQTIYEWRGASAENFDLFPSQFPTASGNVANERGLRLNRRSAPEILEVANGVRALANPQADDLVPVPDAGRGQVSTYWARDAIDEADWIARQFESLHDQGEKWSSMAVLFRKNRDFAAVIDAMARRDIPVEVANVGGLLSVPEVAELRAWLTILERPEDSAALTHILFGSGFRLGMADLAPLAHRAAASRHLNEDEEEPTPVTLLEAMEDSSPLEGLRPGARAALARFYTTYEELLKTSQGLSLVEVLRLLLDRTRAWQNMEALPPNPRLTARLNVYRLLDLAEDWSPLQGRPSLGAFLDHLAVMEEEPAEELDSAHLSGEDAVTLVTVHRAKGLEWDNVAIPTVTRGNFPSGARQYPDPMRFPEALPPALRIDAVMADFPSEAGEEERKSYLREHHHRQEWRVAYVAVTRAKHRLFVTGANWYGLPEPTVRPKKPSELFELVTGLEASVSRGHAPAGDRPTLLRSAAESPEPDPHFEMGWAALLRQARDPAYLADLATRHGVLDDYESMLDETRQRLFDLAEPVAGPEPPQDLSSSVTGLVTYAQCPKRYFWTEVDPLPRRRSAAAIRGTEVHRRIELHQRGQVPFDEISTDLYDAVDDGHAGEMGGFEAYLESRFADMTADLVEAPFTVELAGGFRVRGRIDAVYASAAGWEVVDFKSGRPRNDPSRIVQLQAYAIAAREVDFGIPAPASVDLTFAFLGGGLREERYHADDAWVDSARQSLEDMAQRIAEKQFAPSPGDWCRGCDFLQFCEAGQEWVS